MDLLLETDPDVMIGYNILNFDLPYLYERAAVGQAAGCHEARCRIL